MSKKEVRTNFSFNIVLSFVTMFLFSILSSNVFAQQDVPIPRLNVKPETIHGSAMCFDEKDFVNAYIKARKLKPLIGKDMVLNGRTLIKMVFINDYGEIYFTLLNVKLPSGIKACVFAEIYNGTLNKKIKKLEYKGKLPMPKFEDLKNKVHEERANYKK